MTNIRIDDLKDKKIAIWGLGIETKAVLKILNKKFPNKEIVIIDDNNAKDLLKNVDFVIRSPAVSIYKKEIIEAKKKGVIFITEKTLFFSELKDKKIIAITGSKGKTTTSTFCAYILKKLGYKVLLVGNMGISSINLIDEAKKSDYVVAEISSYQASDLLEFPYISVVLNLYPEHLQWHISHKNYYIDKCHLLEGSKYKIINIKNKKLLNYTKQYNDRIFFNDKNNVHYSRNYFFDGNKKLFSTKNMKLKGTHFYENLCAVLTVLKVLKINFSEIKQEYFDNFEPIEHRMETIIKDNKLYVNDSISTIPEATIACYKTYKVKNIYGILGGFDRKQNYKKLIQYILKNKNIKYLTLLGQTSNRISNELKRINYNNYFLCKSLKDCVNILKTKSKNDNNSVIILSPASASYDMFKNFEDRGNQFKNLI